MTGGYLEVPTWFSLGYGELSLFMAVSGTITQVVGGFPNQIFPFGFPNWKITRKEIVKIWAH